MKTVIKMPRYSAYKDSDYQWIGNIPEKWNVQKLSSCLFPVSEKNRPSLPLLSITRELGVIERDIEDQDTNHNFIPDDLTNYKLLKKGQFGMNKMKAWQGSYGISNYTGIVSPAYFVFDLTKNIETEFFNWAIRSSLYVSYFGSASDGVRIGQWDLSKTRMKSIPFLIPSKNEQIAIVNFLDQKTAQIDQAIAIKQKQIELLKERQQIIIQQAVTKGLNPNVQMKDSGIEWIGMIPEHWKIIPLKRLAVINPSIHIKNKYSTELTCFLPMEKVSVNGEISCDLMKPIREVSQGFTSFAKYDVIVAKITPCFENGKSAYLDNLATAFGYGSTEFHVLRASKLIRGKYLYNIIHSSTFLKMGEAMMTGSAGQKRVPTRFVADFLACLPSLEEQDKIVNYISQQIKASARVISTYQKQIEKLKEYKTTLIDSAVTGKIKITSEE